MNHARNALAAAAALGLALSLGGCHRKGRTVEAMDRELVGNAAGRGDQTDPALTSALEDQIMVDPALTQQKGGAARPGTAPAQAPIPAVHPAPGGPPQAGAGLVHAPAPKPGEARTGMTLGQLARMQAGRQPAPGCTAQVEYGLGWAQRLPSALPLYPDAQVAEAAGNRVPGCNLRVVSFTSGAAVGRLVDFYYTNATRAGYDAEHRVSGADHILAGDRDDAAFYATFHPRKGGGTDVDLVANSGR